MIDPPKNLLDAWAGLWIEALAASGVTDVVMSPVLRSTPFVLAAARVPTLRCHDVLDERSAAFFALGMAKTSGRPPLLICTSGTAGAHYLPAVIEAAQTRTPLLVLTADRPFELMACAASQTIDQTHLYGAYAVEEIELGMPDASEGALRRLRHRAVQAVAAARGGPVHVNARARKPLEPPASIGANENALLERVRAVSSAPLPEAFPPRSLPDPRGIEQVARACLGAKRGLIAAGPGPLSDAAHRAGLEQLARLTGFPLLAEGASQFRFGGSAEQCDAFDLLCRSPRFRQAHHPDVVLQLGRPATSTALEELLAGAPECQRFILAEEGWNDPTSTARAHVLGDLGESLVQLARALERLSAGRTREPTAWSAAWARANGVAWGAAEACAAGEPTLVRAVVRALPAQAQLFVGNSLPIRELDGFCRAADATCSVLSQRGASGIDGLVSGAAGAAAHGTPTALLLGDISFLHDLGGLAAASQVRVPLPVVILNNGGGRLFEQLPVASALRAPRSDPEQTFPAPQLLEHWTTPHQLNFEPAAQLFGVAYARVSTASEVGPALAAAFARNGCTLVEAAVPPHSAQESYARVVARLEEALR